MTARLRELAEQQEHPWGLASAKRCAALVRLASPPYDEEAAAELAEAAAAYGELGLRFDRATVAARPRACAAPAEEVGRGARLARAGRGGLRRARLPGLGRRGALRARPGRRAPAAADRRADAGRAARAPSWPRRGSRTRRSRSTLFVTVHTVEVHLSHAYAKLGVRSRTQLAAASRRRLAPPKV